MPKLAIAVSTARYVDGGTLQLTTGRPLDPTRTPNEVIIAEIAVSILNKPARGPMRNTVVIQVECDASIDPLGAFSGSSETSDQIRLTKGIRNAPTFRSTACVILNGVDKCLDLVSVLETSVAAMLTSVFCRLSSGADRIGKCWGVLWPCNDCVRAVVEAELGW